MTMVLSMLFIVFLTNLLSLISVTLNLTFLLIIKDNWQNVGNYAFFPLHTTELNIPRKCFEFYIKN